MIDSEGASPGWLSQSAGREGHVPSHVVAALTLIVLSWLMLQTVPLLLDVWSRLG